LSISINGFDGKIKMRNGQTSLVLKRLTQVVERNIMMVDSFDTDNRTKTHHENSGDSPRFQFCTDIFKLYREKNRFDIWL